VLVEVARGSAPPAPSERLPPIFQSAPCTQPPARACMPGQHACGLWSRRDLEECARKRALACEQAVNYDPHLLAKVVPRAPGLPDARACARLRGRDYGAEQQLPPRREDGRGARGHGCAPHDGSACLHQRRAWQRALGAMPCLWCSACLHARDAPLQSCTAPGLSPGVRPRLTCFHALDNFCTSSFWSLSLLLLLLLLLVSRSTPPSAISACPSSTAAPPLAISLWAQLIPAVDTVQYILQ